MIRRALSPLVSLTVISVLIACSAEESSKNNGSTATGGGTATGGVTASGGESSSTGGVVATGGSGGTVGTGGGVGTGATAATGGEAGTGATTGTGGAGTGGGTGAAFTCPTVTAGATPNLTGKTTTLVAAAPKVGSDNRFLEGPVWANDTIYVSQLRDWGDPAPGRILRLEGTSLVEAVSDANAGSNGLALRADGKVVVASQGKHALLVFDPANPSVAPETLVTGYMGKGFNSPNDLALRSDGNIYMTDPGWNCGNDCPQGSPSTATNNRVYRVTPTGTVEAVDPPHDKPNGIALSLDGNTLYVAGDNAGIVKYALAADGAIGAQSSFASVQGVDGMTIDCAGNVYASVNAQNRIDVFKPDGSPVGSITTTGSSVTNVAFGGAEHKTLYVTVNTSDGTGALQSVELDIPGYPN